MYQSFYNLTGKPFRLSPDPTFFFPSRGHKRALAYLRYGLHQNEGFVVITGAPGIGKTTLAQILLNEMGEKNIVVAHLTTTQLEADDMLRMVSASFGLRYENLDKAALLKGIESFLLARSRENKRALLVIDEAQNLPMRSLEELRMLSNLQVGDKALLQTFLLGQVQFRNMLENEDLEQLRQRVIANFHLGPLAADESQRYIESRLQHVGWKSDPVFAEIAFEKIHEYTEGVPRRINMLCDRILLFGCMEEQHNITGEVVDAVRAELEQEVGGGATTSKDATKDFQSTHANSETKKNDKAGATVKKTIPQPDKIEPKANVSTSKNSTPPAKNENSIKPSQPVSDALNVAGGRREPQFPADLNDAIDSESEQFIDITQDFIDKFDASISRAKEASTNIDSTNTDKVKSDPRHSSDAARRANSAKQLAESKERKSNFSSAKKEQDQEKRKEKVFTPVIEDDDKAGDTHSADDVMGNTVKRKAPDVSHNNDDGHIEVNVEPSQISERDLFRVITGGKDNRQNLTEEIEPAKLQNPAMSPAASATPSSEDVVLRRILRLVLAFHRSPSSFPGLDDPGQPLPEGVSELLELAVADDQVLTKVSPAAVMGISPVMLRAAVRFFIRRTLFSKDTDHYRMLGLTGNADIADIERHYDLLMRLLRQDKQPGAAEYVDKVGRSYEALMRLDDAPQAQSKVDSRAKATTQTTRQTPVSQSSDDKAAAVLQALENPELTIDFSYDESASNKYPSKPKPKQMPVSAYVGYGTENYIPDPRITRRRIHLMGQAAILGIGALVVVLGIFITQLEPDKAVEKNADQAKVTNKQVEDSKQEMAEASDRRLGLSFNDGSSESLRENFSTSKVTDAPKVTPKIVFDDTSRKASQSSSKKETPRPTRQEVAPVVTSSKAPVVTASNDSDKVSESRQTSKADGKVAIKEQPNPVARPRSTSTPQNSETQFNQVPITVKNNASSMETIQSTANSPVSAPQSKFTAVPVAAKTDIEQQTVADIAKNEVQQKSESGGTDSPALPDVENKFSDTNIPVNPVNVSGGESTLSGVTARGATGNSIDRTSGNKTDTATASITTLTPDTETMSPIEAALSDSSAESQSEELTQLTQPATVAAAPATGKAAISINEFQLSQLLQKFASAYKTGDLNNLMALFAKDARTNTQTTRGGIEREYKTLFSNTASRNITLIEPLWNNEGRFARGVGQFSITIVPQGGEPYTSNGKYTIQVYLEGGQVIISRFYFSNEVTVSRKAVLAGSPTHSDLKNLLTNFTRNYEAGQLDKLMALFANNAQTNDQSSLEGIRKDHAELFKSTQQRQIFLKDVIWQINDKTATGKGNFEVMVQNPGQDSFVSVTGTVTIEVEKSAKGLKITKFLHKTN